MKEAHIMNITILVLLVEDEPMLLINAQDTLHDGGFEVVDASNAQDAIRILEADADSIAGLITDVRLGSGSTGWDVARRARELKPNLPVVYMTAESAEDWSAQGVPKSILVQKPFAPAQLLTAISTLINEASTGL
ncbi:response regulator [uncultured Sphingomonas sp.]|uniref:response regulator n=1 Tax=uncultured Sphingomonas sp. TaxID=158754 RepID=UPI0025EB0D7E|nr:response regulator [uncultured Sphingomonas sp.]